MIVDSHNPRLLGSSQLGKKSNGDWRMSLLPKRAVTSLKVFVGAILMLATLVMPAWAGRVALVVGNADYENVPSLANPRNDAEAMAASLRDMGFEVFDGYDLTRSAFEDLIRDFARGAQGADAAVLYYAGHGLEVASVNYLVPVDANIQDETDLKFETISLTDILGFMEREQRTNLIFLDACRDNPMARNLALNMGTRSVAVGRGLAPVDTGVGTMIAYSTQPGNVALDGEGRHSPFTDALLTHITTPELDVEIMMREVRRDVMQATGGLQVPWSSSSLTGSFVFQLTPASLPAPEAEVEAAEAASVTDAPVAAPEAPRIVSDPVVANTAPEQAAEPEADQPVELALASPTSETPALQIEPLSERELARRTQAALNRLGCNAGTEDGLWGRNSRSALERLAEHAPSLTLASLDPSTELLAAIDVLEGRICPLVCNATEDLIDGACVTKTCPTGQRLSSRGQCYTPQASSGARSSSSNCFTYNGQRFCN